MMTQTHMLVAAALLTRKDAPARNSAVLAGALVPDAAMFVFFAAGVASGTSQSALWETEYWSAGWQSVFAVANSVFVYLALLAAAWTLPLKPIWRGVLFGFSLAALTHLAGDFPVHADDAHSHFWPVSDWRFESPISYWDRRHHGDVFAFVEGAITLIAAFLLIRRFKAKWVWALCGICAALVILHTVMIVASAVTQAA